MAEGGFIVEGANRTGELPPAFTRGEEEWPVPWQPLWGSDDRLVAHLESHAARLLLGFLSRSGRWGRTPVIETLARIAPLFDRRHADAARAWLVQALGEMPPAELERRVRHAYRHFARVAWEIDWLARRAPDPGMLDRYEFHWTDEVREAFENPGGRILVSGHIGNWEAAMAVLPWLSRDPAYAIAKPARNRPFSKMVQEQRERFGGRLLPRRGAMSTAGMILRAGGSLAMLLDQRARKRPVLAPFFGRPARCDRSAGVLLRRLRAPVVVLATYLGEKPLTWRVEFADVIGPEEVANADPATIAARINRSLEKLILAEPDQYFWLHDRYKDTPREFPPAADEAPPRGERTTDERDAIV
jgi:Kdo2-lipid IVA lauroyltransferase/acyltransferase